MTPLMELRGIELRYGQRRVLHDLHLTIHEGECLALVGPNGAGKTTLLRLVAGLLEPDKGEVKWRSEALANLDSRQRARRIAYVPQIRPARIPFTVEDLLLQGRYPHRERLRLGPSTADLDVVESILTTIGLAKLRKRRIDRLSGGERQVAFIGAALVQESPLLVLDEPTTHLDPAHRSDVARLLGRLRQSGEQTVLLATHDLHLAAHLGDRAATLAEGRLQTIGPAEEVFSATSLEQLFENRFAFPELDGRTVPMPELP